MTTSTRPRGAGESRHVWKRTLAGSVAALALLGGAVGAAPLAWTKTCFTGPETKFLSDIRNDGVTWASDRQQVDDGWAILHDINDWKTPYAEAGTLWHNSQVAHEQGKGMTFAQAQAEVGYALTDLTGTSPSPGGQYNDANTRYLGVCGSPANAAGQRE